MVNYTAFNYNDTLKSRDLSKLYETQEFEPSTTEQEYISLSDLVEDGVSGVLRSNTGRKKYMSYDDVIEPVGRFDLSDFNPNELKEAKDYFNNKEKANNVQVNQDGVSSGSSVAKPQLAKEEVSSVSK